MNMNIHVGVALVGLSVLSSIAFAQSLKDKEYFADQEKYLAGEVSSTNERCGNSLTAKFDWLKPPAPEDRKTYSAYGYCGAALEAVRRVCDSQAGKEAVKQKIKSLTCSFGPKRTVVLKDGAIDYEVNFNSIVRLTGEKPHWGARKISELLVRRPGREVRGSKQFQ
jgi:hypothetical protein